MSWSIDSDANVASTGTVAIRVTQKHSWRRSAAPSFWNTPMCDANTIANGSALLGEDYLVCRSADCGYISSYSNRSISTQVLCNDHVVEFDYASGERQDILVLPINRQFEYSFASCCWIPLIRVGTPDWAVTLVIDTHRRVNGQ